MDNGNDRPGGFARKLTTGAAVAATWAASVGASAQSQQPIDPRAPEVKVTIPEEPKEEKPSQFFETLNKNKKEKDAKPYLWIDQDGNEVNLKALETAKLKGKQFTMAFGFEKCKVFCGPSNEKLKALHEMNPDLVHVVVAVNPEEDGTEAGRKTFIEKLKKNIGIKDTEKDKVIILFAVKADAEGKMVKDKAGNPVFDTSVAPAVQYDNLNATNDKSNPLAHTPNIYLFDSKGAIQAKKFGTRPVEEFQKEWKQYMPTEEEKKKAQGK